MFERIVAAIDADPARSNKVLEAAQEVGRAFGSQVLVAHVREVERSMSMVAATPRPGAIPPSIHFESEEEAQAIVEEAVGRLQQAGLQAEGRVGGGSGSTARELLDIVREHGSNLIVIGDRGESRMSDVLLGSVAHRVVHLAPCPVLLVR